MTRLIMTRRLLWLLTLVMVAGVGQISAKGEYKDFSDYEKREFVSSAGMVLPYRLLVPEEIEPGRKYPLVLFLHGAGERGSDNEAQLTHGGQMWLNPVNRAKYPAFVVAPQCPATDYWAYPERPSTFVADSLPDLAEPTRAIAALRELVEEYTANLQVDAGRIYVMGLSMGGMAVYDLAARYPEVFAAAVPICGVVKPERLAVAAQVPFRIYHGDDDSVVPVWGSRNAYCALRQAGATVDYFEFPGVNHGSWNNAFNDRDLLPWLFSQHK